MKKFVIGIVFCFLFVGAIYGQRNYLITNNSVGSVRLGMTVAQARKVLKGFQLSRTSDGEGVALIAVKKGEKEVMTFYADESNTDAPINEKAKIEFIEVWGANYRTAAGVHPEMLIKNAEKILGRVNEIFTSEIESREFATFRKKPKGFMFRVGINTEGKYFTAGDYLKRGSRTAKYNPGAYILSVQISGYDL